MKLAVSTTGNDLNAAVDPRFGRTQWFIIFDTDTARHEIIDNQQNLQAAQGAGIQAAQHVVSQGVGVVLTGHCGPKAFKTLKAAGIEVCIGASGSVSSAIEKYTRGELKPTDCADVEGHW